MKICFAAISSLALLAAPLSMAEAEEPISYMDAVQRCAEFVNDPQIVTIEFRVSCFDESLEWKETGRSRLSNGNSANVGHRIVLKEKWLTPDFLIPIVQLPTRSECPILTQYKTSRQTDVVLSCNEFVQKYSEPEMLAQHCQTALKEAAPQTEETGRQINLCGGTALE